MITKNGLFDEIEVHLLLDNTPSEFINSVSEDPLFNESPFKMLTKLKDTQQSKKYHPEGSAWNHTMMVVDVAATLKDKSRNAKVFMWAALLHDIGKPQTTRHHNGKITAYNHDKMGAELAKNFLYELTNDYEFIEKVVALVRWHMQILYVVNDMQFKEIRAMSEQVDTNEIALLGLCDRLGRTGADIRIEENNIRIFIEKCK